MVAIKLYDAIYATSLDNDEEPGEMEGWPLNKGSKRALKGLGRARLQ